MSQPIVLDANEAMRSVRAITELIQKIASLSTAFRDEIEAAYDASELSFLKRVANAMGKIESTAKSLKENFEEIQDSLTRYVREMEDYSDDTAGFN